jgi:hypothetical protein
MEKFEVGQKVKVFDVNGRRRGQPKGGWEGEIVKVGRKLVTITYPGHYRPKAFRIDDQMANDEYRHQSFSTLEQAEQTERRQRAMDTLNGIGLDRSYDGEKLTLEQLEALVNVITTHPAFIQEA